MGQTGLHWSCVTHTCGKDTFRIENLDTAHQGQLVFIYYQIHPTGNQEKGWQPSTVGAGTDKVACEAAGAGRGP